MQASASGSTTTSGIAPPCASTSLQSVTPGCGPASRTPTSLTPSASPGVSANRASRSVSANKTLGEASCIAKAISSPFHHAFMPTAATPTETQAQ